ncbi:uncharacterized protein LOC110815163 [Carica papaya]|uniref:uncharacterized protein LOC110815163 n=1 Tax=Carica papaya TaxID=3649 RepID=UPI000B8CC4D3|nr:uncharacterized protein LOC110815163 [Carica papaya]
MAFPNNLLAASSTTILFFFLVFSSSLEAVPLPPNSKLTKLKERACHATNSYTFCMKRLNRNPQAISAKTDLDLQKAILEMGKTKALRIQTVIYKMRVSKDPRFVAVKPALAVCANSYISIVGSFQAVAELELEEDLLSANYDIMVLFDYIGYCEDALAKATARLPDMAIANRAMKYFISMAATATNGLE